MAEPSVLSRVAPESVLLAGAGRALLLQLAHPAIGHGVARHSDFAADPLKRFHGTLTYIYALTNGTPAQAAAARAWVDRAHAPVRGTAADDGGHPAYDARDPELQLWVAATLYDSAELVYDAVYPGMTGEEAEALYRDYALLGTALQMPVELWPATRADFRRYWDAAVARLEVDDTVRDVAARLLSGAGAPAWARMLLPVARLLTAGMLPGEVRRMFGLRYGPGRDAAYRLLLRAAAVVFPRLPRAVRHAPMRHYLARLEAAE